MNPNFVQINGAPYYKISHSEALSPFFINVPSASDIWIFLSSTGGLTAGRKNAGGNLFPYETDDKLMQGSISGSKTFVRVDGQLWQPFANAAVQPYQMQQNIYKSCYASSVILEEINETLALAYRYEYQSSEQYGFVKTATLTNLGDTARTLEVLDGLSNILPYGVDPTLQATSSTLVDAYRVAELAGENLAIYALSTTINDTPNPIEPLRANICYHTKGAGTVYLNEAVTKLFAAGEALDCNRESLGGKSGYYIAFTETLAAGKESSYSFVLDSGYDHSALAAIVSFVAQGDFAPLFADIQKGVQDLVQIVEKADGLQQTGDAVATAAHYLSTLYNCMRGGIFEGGYALDVADFLKFISLRNQKMHGLLTSDAQYVAVKDCTTVQQLKECAERLGDATLQRLVLEYMPLSFSRRHGDPSRPWNKFNIAIKDENGAKALYYEGNWRDIFQNWEALGLSYPAYYQNMVAKFVNASTFDGFNPYRITTVGIDWEKPEPENPFSGLGYWGDHQIIYLLRLLQGLEQHYPAQLSQMLTQEIFSYANVPYRIASYESILQDSKNTMSFDFEADAAIEALIPSYGSDARLILQGQDVLMVSLAEKLLVPALSKISNLMVGGGIWMNTARPEWNDANNAIVGIGLSMVTVYHLSAYLEFLLALFAQGEASYSLTANVAQWLAALTASLASCEGQYQGKEKALLDALGRDFDAYRNRYYQEGLGAKEPCDTDCILAFLTQAKQAVAATIAQNKSEVFSSYNILGDDFSVSPLQTMLEGQSAAVGSGLLAASDVCDLVEGMQAELYSTLHQAHTLYPVRPTKRFLSKNTLEAPVGEISGVVHADCNGELHFDSSLRTAPELLAACSAAGCSDETTATLAAEYERLFAHKKFTGRSGVMYKFEGIGCVYWHQNAKFLLAILETAQRAKAKGEDITEIYALYHKLLQGFIYRKTPQQCNAIPIEPYSHSSYTGKSEQPGMTGQVKESLLMRRGELGVQVAAGQISFDPAYLRAEEFDAKGKVHFAICAVPVCYRKGAAPAVQITFANGTVVNQNGYTLAAATSADIFGRTGVVQSICITV
ncbi:MAG: hypothetical protein R3Y06_05835 [Faecalibacterium sp.]